MNKQKIILVYFLLMVISPSLTKAAEEVVSPKNNPTITTKKLPDSKTNPNENNPKKLESENKPDTKNQQETKEKPNNTENEEIFLSFENAELVSFVNYIADLKKWNIIPDKAMTGNKISLTIRNPIKISQAETIFYTILDKAGFAMVKVGDVYKIISKDKRTKEPLPVYINVRSSDLPDSDITLRYVAFLENIKVQDVSALLRSMLDPTAMIVEQPDVNCIIIADKSFNIKAAMKIIQELDKSGLKETVAVLKLKYANATEVEGLFKSLIEEKPDANPLARLLGKKAENTTAYFPATTKIFAEERTNSLILLGTAESIEKVIDFIKNHVDTALRKVESPLHVFELQYADAKQMATLLNDALIQPESVAGQAAAKFGAVRGGVKYFKKMIIQAEPEGNRLLISCSDKNDWKLLKQTLKDLDKPQPQVAIENLVISVDITDDRQIDSHIRNKFAGQIGTGINFQSASSYPTVMQTTNTTPPTNLSLLGNLISVVTGQLGQTLLTFGRPGNVWAIFDIIKQDTNTTLIAQPFLTVTNKYKATISVGTIKRVVTQTTVASSSGTVTSGYNDIKAALEVDVKPQINIDGVINLNIVVKLDQFLDPTGLNTSRRSVSTNVSVADGQILALGGLVINQTQEQEYKTPILGDIPIIGWMFKSKQKVITKSNILVFMCPTIVKPRSSQGINPYTQMKLDLVKENINEGMPIKTRDPVHNWFFNPEQKSYITKVQDYESARFQPSTVDIRHDPFYRSTVKERYLIASTEKQEEIKNEQEAILPKKRKNNLKKNAQNKAKA